MTELTIAPVLRRRRRLPTSLVVGGALVLALVAVATLAQWIAPYPFDQMHVSDRFMPPNLHYLAGTDEYGRDVFSRLLFESQLSLALGVTATLNSMGIGVPLGLIAGYCRSVTDELELKGFAEPVPAWRVFSARDVESRFAATRAGSSAPLVGRQEEMGLLLRAWEGSCRGRGQVVLIQGEAGVGKSRLLEALREASGKDHIWVAMRCSPFHTASAFHPIIEHLKRVFGWQPEDAAQQHLAKLEAGLGGFSTLPRSESVRLFADLMAVPLPEDQYPRLSMAQQQRDATIDAIVAWLIETAERAPVLVGGEDLHWADPTSLETLGMLIERCGQGGVNPGR